MIHLFTAAAIAVIVYLIARFTPSHREGKPGKRVCDNADQHACTAFVITLILSCLVNN